MQQLFGSIALIALATGTIFSMFPLWRSATLSPDSIKRRVWWTCCGITIVSLFCSQLPYWQGGVFVSALTGLALFTIAGFWTNFIKINGRVYGAFTQDRPDRPPVLARDEESD